MRVYFSGITGTGLGPLALMAKGAGIDVVGSDRAQGAITGELEAAGIRVKVGEQDGEFLKQEMRGGVDWFVYTSALAEDHPELMMARRAGIKVTKRDDFTAFLVDKMGLKMVAVAGTHGKTTTTAMIVYAAKELGISASYIVGTTLGFASSGAYHVGDEYFIYEADEYDRNFLKYHPWLAVIPCVSYDHPDIYPTRRSYEEAFLQFEGQCQKVIKVVDDRIVCSGMVGEDVSADVFRLAGEARRMDAKLAAMAIHEMAPDVKMGEIVNVLNDFPGVGRRFERVADGLYTDYAHHPEEIQATLDVARDEARMRGRSGVVVVYQPHQNTRQHEVRSGYNGAMIGADKIYWLPTYLTRENPRLRVLSPEELTAEMPNRDKVEFSEMDDELISKIRRHLADNNLVVLMTAGPADGWLRKNFQTNC